ncbi:TetR family transcriptional regulator [Tamaricihabitans halophyticus]|uniref:TetR family transcriptional regulator n=1 Tax=Tamaricihabitans halophyticus TaxID=1262583 RepID=A0A4R2QH78_9PSEU|nr:TetR/AcrR family transcriptional regulator [Tamaricihabitans halophyticus]TCP48603.1 TetR family transcriptional regulator [Tamaricihabitans halophyticus]
MVGSSSSRRAGKAQDPSARERILSAAEELFAARGFDATPTSRIADRAGVPKGLVHYYFRRKRDLLVALVDRLPSEAVEPASVVVQGDLAASLRGLVAELDARLASSRVLSHLLWREADTHEVVRVAMQERYQRIVDLLRTVILAAGAGGLALADVDSAAGLLALAVSYRHSVARHSDVRQWEDTGQAGTADPADDMRREVAFIATALQHRCWANG